MLRVVKVHEGQKEKIKDRGWCRTSLRYHIRPHPPLSQPDREVQKSPAWATFKVIEASFCLPILDIRGDRWPMEVRVATYASDSRVSRR